MASAVDSLRATFERLAAQRVGLYHAYVFVEPAAFYFSTVPDSVIALALESCPIVGAKLIAAEGQGHGSGASVYMAHSSVDEAAMQLSLAEFKAAGDLVRQAYWAKEIALKTLVPRLYVGAAQIASERPDGSGYVSGGGSTGCTDELAWLDHLYVETNPPTISRPQHGHTYTVRALRHGVFQTSLDALGTLGPDTDLISLDEAGKLVGVSSKRLQNYGPEKGIALPTPRIKSRPNLYSFLEMREFLAQLYPDRAGTLPRDFAEAQLRISATV